MELPKGIETRYGNGKTHILKLLKNLYGQKQAGRVWNQHLTKGLKVIGFKQSNVDECIFFCGKVIFIVFTDDGIFASISKEEIDKAICEMKQHFNLEDQGDIKDYLGVNVEQMANGDIKLTQPHLIKQIVDKLNCLSDLPVIPLQGTLPKCSNEKSMRHPLTIDSIIGAQWDCRTTCLTKVS
jgi:hypothetical protein